MRSRSDLADTEAQAQPLVVSNSAPKTLVTKEDSQELGGKSLDELSVSEGGTRKRRRRKRVARSQVGLEASDSEILVRRGRSEPKRRSLRVERSDYLSDSEKSETRKSERLSLEKEGRGKALRAFRSADGISPLSPSITETVSSRSAVSPIILSPNPRKTKPKKTVSSSPPNPLPAPMKTEEEKEITSSMDHTAMSDASETTTTTTLAPAATLEPITERFTERTQSEKELLTKLEVWRSYV